MDEVGAQVATPVVIHQSLPQRFCSMQPIARKRGLPFTSSNFGHQNPSDNWNPASWEWDNRRFVAKPLQCDGGQMEIDKQIPPNLARRKEVQSSASNHTKIGSMGKDDENLQLKLGDGVGSSSGNGMNYVEETQPVSRSYKRVRAGSPSGGNHPTCQVDNCEEDLSSAKDYHRRHKVCEVHSKASQALVGKHMQRFCQQCSRFHTLSEFDEGKRSCRRRLAGHNRRRRKTQPEDTIPRVLVPGSPPENSNCDMDIINLLAVLARAQGNTEERSGLFSSMPEKDQLIQILSKINSLPLPANLAAKIPPLRTANGSIPNVVCPEIQNQMNGNSPSPSTKDLLAVLSAAPGTQSSDAQESQTRPSAEGSDSEKSKSPGVDRAAYLNLQKGSRLECPSVGGERSSTSYHSPVGEADCHVQEASPSLELQLCSSSPEDTSARILPVVGNYPSSNSSNPSGDRSPVSSPVLVHNLFPMRRSGETTKDGRLSNSEDELAYAKSTMGNGCNTSLKLFGGSIQVADNGSIQSSPYRAGYTSSGSDHSPSSLSSEDRTGRIIFKLFDKDPGQLPGSLRTQVYNWLSSSPLEMESYIRPGCIVLSLYLSMPSFFWDQLEENLLDYVNTLVKDIDVGFWGSGRFLVYTYSQMASHTNGRIRLCKSWKSWSAPQIISVSPVAIVAGEETSVVLRGRRLKIPGTKIHCTHTNGFSTIDVGESSSEDDACDEICLSNFKVQGLGPNVLGRCFIEAENSSKGTTFPVIIADDTICQELRRLEPVIHVTDCITTNDIHNTGMSKTQVEVLHFLNELGWLFQRKCNAALLEAPVYGLARFKFLLVYSVEHDFCAVVKTLLDILLELNLGKKEIAQESFTILSEIHLLNRAVKRRCCGMVDMLIHYTVPASADNSETFLFVPNLAGPGGVTPLHLAACTTSSEDIIDTLTSDPQEIGLQSWNSVLDANGLSPHAYALMRNNHSYNALVAQKLTNHKNAQVSISVENEVQNFQIDADKSTPGSKGSEKSCSRCAIAAANGYGRRFASSQVLIQRPYIHSMLVVAAVCVCVCLFLRGHPYVGCVAPFAWDNLDFGAS